MFLFILHIQRAFDPICFNSNVFVINWLHKRITDLLTSCLCLSDTILLMVNHISSTQFFLLPFHKNHFFYLLCVFCIIQLFPLIINYNWPHHDIDTISMLPRKPGGLWSMSQHTKPLFLRRLPRILSTYRIAERLSWPVVS